MLFLQPAAFRCELASCERSWAKENSVSVEVETAVDSRLFRKQMIADCIAHVFMQYFSKVAISHGLLQIYDLRTVALQLSVHFCSAFSALANCAFKGAIRDIVSPLHVVVLRRMQNQNKPNPCRSSAASGGAELQRGNVPLGI